MDKPRISIITPSYNQAKFIRKTIESVLCCQDYDNIEYIVVDGRSSDGTLEILKEYKKKHPEIFHYIYEEDSGQTNAINKGFKMATGEIIGWLNSDDYYESFIFRFIVAFFQDNQDVDMVYGGCNRVDENGNFIGRFEEGYGFKKCRIKNYKEFNYNTLLNIYSGLIPQQTVFFRRRVVEIIGYLDESYDFTMDYEYWLRIGNKCKIVRIDKTLANFRTHNEAKTNFKNRYAFIRESLAARRKNGGCFSFKFYSFIYSIALKTFLKGLLIRIKILRDIKEGST